MQYPGPYLHADGSERHALVSVDSLPSGLLRIAGDIPSVAMNSGRSGLS
ncbi:MAG: hypothetical protein ACOH5I_23165 [Oligoflexus sp.]